MIDERFIFLSALISLWAVGVYIVGTLRGKVLPNRISWFLISLPPMIAFAGEISESGFTLSSLRTFLAGFGPFMIFVASFLTKAQAYRLTLFDYACGVLSVCGLVFWWMTQDARLAVIFAIVADGMAFVPTMVKAWKQPETECAPTFLLSTLSVGIALLTIQEWTFMRYAFPLYMFVVCILMVGTIVMRGRRENSVSI